MRFQKTHSAKRGTSTYKSDEGLVIYLPKSAGDHPAELEVEGLTAPAAKVAKVKMTPEERKAAAAEKRAKNAGLTPAQKLAAEEERLEKRRQQLEKRRVELAAADGATA